MGTSLVLKVIRCLMRKLDLLSLVRRRRPYVHYKQAVHKYSNLLQRDLDDPSIATRGLNTHPKLTST